MNLGTEPPPPALSGALAAAFEQPMHARWPSLLQVEQAVPETPWLRWAQVRALRSMGRLVEAETRARRVMDNLASKLSIAERRRVLVEWGWCLSALNQPDQAYQVAREALIEGRETWNGTVIDPLEESRIAWAIARFAAQGGDEDEGVVWLRCAVTAETDLYQALPEDPVLSLLTSPPPLPLLERLRAPLLCLVADGLAEAQDNMTEDNARIILSTVSGLIWVGRYSTHHGMDRSIPEVLRNGVTHVGESLVDTLISKRTRVPAERLWPALHVRAHLQDVELPHTDQALAGRRPPNDNPQDPWIQAVLEWWPRD
ncbi:MAG: hypothetical protein AAGA48_32395 [Myxococcota bacterium]